eukprot:11154690-Lingulodinium_polyedra.AAC.1
MLGWRRVGCNACRCLPARTMRRLYRSLSELIGFIGVYRLYRSLSALSEFIGSIGVYRLYRSLSALSEFIGFIGVYRSFSALSEFMGFIGVIRITRRRLRPQCITGPLLPTIFSRVYPACLLAPPRLSTTFNAACSLGSLTPRSLNLQNLLRLLMPQWESFFRPSMLHT